MKTFLQLPTQRVQLVALILLVFLLLPFASRAQAPTAWACDGTFYQIRQATVNNTNVSVLYRVNRDVNPYTTTPLVTFNVLLNALAYNSQDNYLYAVSYVASTSNNGNPPPVNLYRIGANGVLVNLGITSLPRAYMASGAFDQAGNYYLTTQNTDVNTFAGNLYRLRTTGLVAGSGTSANPIAPTVQTFRTAANAVVDISAYDIAFNPVDGRLYGVRVPGSIYRITPNLNASAVLTETINSPQGTLSEAVGTAFFDVAGNLYSYANGTVGTANSGKFYLTNVTTAAYTLLNTIDPAAISDGASCVSPSERIDVVKSVGALSSAVGTSTTTYTVPFTIQVRNTNATVTAPNVQVSELLVSSLATDPVTFPGASSITIGARTISGTGTVPTLNANFNGRSGNAGLLVGNQSLTPGQTLTIAFQVQVTYPNGSIPSIAYNTAYATSSALSNAGYTIINGALVPPNDLLANDLSTNGNALPNIGSPNTDNPSPTPIPLSALSITGTVFEDVNYGGGPGRALASAPGASVRGGVRVELYNTSTGAYVGATITAANGTYSFTSNLTSGASYTVRVVNSTVTSSRNAEGVAGLIGVQTYANGSNVGGQAPAGTDAEANSSGSLTSLNSGTAGTPGYVTAQSLATVTLNAAQTGVDFGFNFDTVVNTRDAGQGSLRQFVINANALSNNTLAQVGQTAGVENSIFMIPAASLTNGVAVINLVSPLVLTDANTVINGLTQTAQGNTNNTTLGTGGTVGTAATNLSLVNGPEVQLVGSTAVPIGIDIAASATNAGVQGIAIYGFGNATNSNANANIRVAANNVTLTQNVIGATATSFVAPTLATNADNVRILTGSTGAQITNNLIGYANGNGISLQANAAGAPATPNGVTISNNQVTGNGRTLASASGISLLGFGSSVTGNLINANNGNGVDSNNGTTSNTGLGGNTIAGNTVTGNGVGGTTTAGIRLYGAGSAVNNNVINANYGAGIMGAASAANNTFSQNSISANGTIPSNSSTAATGQIGIDLLNSTDNADRGSGSFVTLNADGKTTSSGGNSLLNFPVITQSRVNNNILYVTGFAPAGATVEFFVASTSSAGFGQGQTFIASRVEGSANDTDDGVGNYSGVINGVNQGSGVSRNRFLFQIPLNTLSSALQTALNGTNTRITATSTVSGTGTSEFSGNAPVSAGPLPVELTSFAVTASGADALLSWSTASEKNNAYFQVERSLDGTRFGPLTQVSGQGTTTSAQRYSYRDANAAQLGALLYYRLRQVDRDGTESFSPVRSVRLEAPQSAVTLYPNPTAGLTSLDLRPLQAGAAYTITLLDLTGRVIHTQTLTGGTVHQLAFGELRAGSYVLQLSGPALGRQVLPLVLMR